MAGYVCGKCKFGFYRTGEVDACPACGSMSVRFINASTGDDSNIVPLRRRIPLNLRADEGIRPYKHA
jgi:uncharacterized Zn finger protein (UPF0148 family)